MSRWILRLPLALRLVTLALFKFKFRVLVSLVCDVRPRRVPPPPALRRPGLPGILQPVALRLGTLCACHLLLHLLRPLLALAGSCLFKHT